MVTTRNRSKNRPRDSEATRARILRALGRMIVRDGLSSVGINALAREARCDKVLIYRNFGDLNGVYDAFAACSDFWWSVDDLVGKLDPGPVPLGSALKQILRRHTDAIRSRPVTLAVLASELTARTPLVVALEKVREQRSLALAQWVGEHYRVPAGVDFEAISMILGVAINYLAVRGRKIRVMSGIPIKTDKDWERILAAVDGLIDGVSRAA